MGFAPHVTFTGVTLIKSIAFDAFGPQTFRSHSWNLLRNNSLLHEDADLFNLYPAVQEEMCHPISAGQ